LTGIKISNLETARQAMDKLHEMGAKTVMISSTNLGSDEILVGVGSTVASKNS
jgi:pyridoxine kinase